MERHVWDHYAHWGNIADSDTAADLKVKITGHRQEWLPNTASDGLVSLIRDIISTEDETTSGPVTVVDFGCGLGRNLPLLRTLFPRVVGLDIPEMIKRLRGEQAADTGVHYDAIYDDIGQLLAAEKITFVYDSVVFQHIVDPLYVSGFVDQLTATPSFSTVISLSFIECPVAALDFLVGDYRWKTVYSELDTTSFFGNPHQLRVLRRPARWTVELQDNVIGLKPDSGEWRPITINGGLAKYSSDWILGGLITDLAPTLMVLFERAGLSAVWFVDETGRHIGNTVDDLPEAARLAARSDLREMLGPWLRRKFKGTGRIISNGLLELVAPSKGP